MRKNSLWGGGQYEKADPINNKGGYEWNMGFFKKGSEVPDLGTSRSYF